MRAAVIQLCSTDNVAANVKAASERVAEAADSGAELIALPEMFPFLRREGSEVTCAQALDGEIVETVRGWAKTHQVRLVAGSFPELAPESDRLHNTSLVISATGDIEAVYRKIHLFDVDLGAEGGGTYRESDRYAPGSDVVVTDTGTPRIGLSICYDLRFPELYRRCAELGAEFAAVPSAFTPHTGKDHWEVLLRARAIENQLFLLAPAQCGTHSPDRASYGHSMIISPWGVVLAQLQDRPGVAIAECDLEELSRIRRQLPALRHRRI